MDVGARIQSNPVLEGRFRPGFVSYQAADRWDRKAGLKQVLEDWTGPLTWELILMVAR